MSEEDIKWNSYFYDNTDVLKNNLGIMDKEKLKGMESLITFEKLVDLYENPIIGNFDKEHLCNIHKYIFGDIYSFAGEYRTVYMQKGNSYFTHVSDIDRELEIVLKEMHDELKHCITHDDYSIFLANTYSALIKVHPFREGNGRTVREFLRELIEHVTEYELDWSKVDSDNMLEGIRNSFFTKTLLDMEFKKALVNKKTINR